MKRDHFGIMGLWKLSGRFLIGITIVLAGGLTVLTLLPGRHGHRAVSLTPEENEYIRTHGPFRYAPDPRFPPLEFFDAGGEAAGVTPDVLEIISRNLEIEFATIRYRTWTEVLEGVKRGEVDLLGTLTLTKEREEYLLFSRPYLHVPYVLFVGDAHPEWKSLGDAASASIGVVRSYGAHAWLIEHHPELAIVPVEDSVSGLTMVATGRLDAMVETLPVGVYVIRQKSLVNIRMLPSEIFETPQHLAVLRSDPMLLSILQKGLDSISENEMTEIFVRWTGHDLSRPVAGVSPAFLRFLWGALIVLLVAYASVASWTFSLRRAVAARTGELRRSEERYRLLFERNVAGVYRSTVQGTVLECNEAFSQIYGYASPSELASRTAEEFYVDSADRAAFVSSLKETGTVQNRQAQGRKKDGTLIWILENAGLVEDKVRNEMVIEGTIIDITDRVHAEVQLRHSQKMEAIGKLAGGVAHDFNNLLQVLLSSLDVFRMRWRGIEGADGTIAELEAHVRRGAALTRQLLLFARREVVYPELIDINEVIRGANVLLGRLIRENIRFSVLFHPDPLTVTADQGQLEQVLVNLVVNASDSMPEGGEIIIETGRGGEDEVWFEVRDTGTGIAPELQSRVFEPFFTTKSSERGTGLGLAVVDGIVTRHRGRVELTSRVGEGSAFRIVLPAAEAEPAAIRPTSEPAEGPVRGNGERVLLVEDEAATREALADMLALLGYEATAAATGEEAEVIAAGAHFDVLLTDFVLSGIDGWRLTQRLRQRIPGLGVIVMSGYAEDEAVRNSVSEGEVHFLQKPFEMSSLARELRAVLKGWP